MVRSNQEWLLREANFLWPKINSTLSPTEEYLSARAMRIEAIAMPIQHHLIKPFGYFPVVTCPGCHVVMSLKELHPASSSNRLYSAKYRCPRCDTETLREFKRDAANS
jgi:hypothetical protein